MRVFFVVFSQGGFQHCRQEAKESEEAGQETCRRPPVQ